MSPRQRRKPMSSWTGDDLRHWAAKIGCKYMNYLCPLINRSRGALGNYTSGRLPIPMEVQETIMEIYQAQIKLKHAEELGDLERLQAQILADKVLAPTHMSGPVRQHGNSGTHYRLPGYFARNGVPIPRIDRAYAPKWLTVRQATSARAALKHWAQEVACRYKVLTSEVIMKEHRLELANIKAMLLALPRPDHITQPWVLQVCEWPVLSRALRNYYTATNEIHAYSFYQCIRRNLNVSKKLTVGSSPRPQPPGAREGGGQQ